MKYNGLPLASGGINPAHRKQLEVENRESVATNFTDNSSIRPDTPGKYRSFVPGGELTQSIFPAIESMEIKKKERSTVNITIDELTEMPNGINMEKKKNNLLMQIKVIKISLAMLSLTFIVFLVLAFVVG